MIHIHCDESRKKKRRNVFATDSKLSEGGENDVDSKEENAFKYFSTS